MQKPGQYPTSKLQGDLSMHSPLTAAHFCAEEITQAGLCSSKNAFSSDFEKQINP